MPSKLQVAKELLAKIKDKGAEYATKLTGKADKEYRKALDLVYGKDRISKDSIDLYHASKSEEGFPYFKKSAGGYAGSGVYAGLNKKEVNQYDVGGKLFELVLQNPKTADITNKESVMKLAKELGIEKEIKPNDWNQYYYDLLTAYVKKIDPEFKLIGNEKSDALNKAITDLGYDSIKFKHQSDRDVINVLKPEKLREKSAAFNPDFKDSKLLMAGVGAIPVSQTMSPLEGGKQAVQSLADAWDAIKTSIAQPIAEQTSIMKNKHDVGTNQDLLKGLMDFGVGGAPGTAIGAAQMFADDNTEKKKQAIMDLRKTLSGGQ